MSTATVGRESAFRPFIVLVVAFHVAWIAWPYIIYPKIYPKLLTVGDRTFEYALLNLSLRLMLLVAPVILYLRYVDDVNPLEYLG